MEIENTAAMGTEEMQYISNVCQEEFHKVLASRGEQIPYWGDAQISIDDWIKSWEAISVMLDLPKIANPEGIPNLGWSSSLGWYARKLINQERFKNHQSLTVSPCGLWLRRKEGGQQG